MTMPPYLQYNGTIMKSTTPSRIRRPAPPPPSDRLLALGERIDKFNKDREWDQFHSPGNLAKSIAIEAGELLECFQWNDAGFDRVDVLGELADVANYCIQLAQVLGVDLIDVVNAKMDLSEKKYPVEKAKGVSTKYTKL